MIKAAMAMALSDAVVRESNDKRLARYEETFNSFITDMISKIEKGQVELGIKKIMKFAEIFGVPADVLMGFDISEAYNEASPDTQAAVCAVLGIRREEGD